MAFMLDFFDCLGRYRRPSSISPPESLTFATRLPRRPDKLVMQFKDIASTSASNPSIFVDLHKVCPEEGDERVWLEKSNAIYRRNGQVSVLLFQSNC